MTRSPSHPGYPPPRSQPREPDPRQATNHQFDPWAQPAQLAGGGAPPSAPRSAPAQQQLPAAYGQPSAYPGYPEPAPYAPGQYQQPDPYAHQQGWPADGSGQQWAAPQPAAPAWPSDPLTSDGYQYPTSAEGAPAAPPPRSAFAPQFDSYVPPSQPGRARAGAPPAPVAPTQAPPQGAPDLRGAMFDDWRGETTEGGRARHAAPQPAAPPAGAYGHQAGYTADPYAHGGLAQDGYGQEPHFGPSATAPGGYAQPPQAAGAAQGYAQDWTHNDPYAAPHAQAQHGGYAGEPGYADPAAYPAQGYGAPQGQAMAVHPDYEDDEYDDDVVEEPRRSSRMLLIAGALVSAIVVGGGLAYGYKMLVGPDPKVAGGAPVVRGGADPTKTRPSDPGGRKFEHADSKILGRLSGQGGQAATSEDAGGAKRVSTMVVGRDGSIQEAPQAQAPAYPAPSNPVVSVPGLTVVDGFAGRRAAAQPATAPPSALGGPVVITPPARPQPQEQQRAQQVPIVLTRNGLAAEQPAATTRAEKAPAVAQPQQRTAAAPAIPKFETRATPAREAPASEPAVSGAGFVVVLASVPVSATSRMDALRQFANMQQRYGSLLTAKAPEVRETNIAAKGKYHRLLVGPPASKSSASALCEGLKSAGYPSCWITPY